MLFFTSLRQGLSVDGYLQVLSQDSESRAKEYKIEKDETTLVTAS